MSATLAMNPAPLLRLPAFAATTRRAPTAAVSLGAPATTARPAAPTEPTARPSRTGGPAGAGATGGRDETRLRFALPPVLRRALWSLVVVVATVIAARVALARIDQPVQQLAISGLGTHVDAEAVRAAAAAAVEAPLLQVDLAAVREAVERLPWVASARVDRVWPGELAVRVQEREVFARWGTEHALSTEGVVFPATAKELPGMLPKLSGPAGREAEVMETYRRLADRLTETAFAPAGLALDARGDWTATTGGNVQLRFGRGDPLVMVERLKSVVLPALSGRLPQVARIDLRYANGFAVAWRDAQPTSLQLESFLAPANAATGAEPGDDPDNNSDTNAPSRARGTDAAPPTTRP